MNLHKWASRQCILETWTYIWQFPPAPQPSGLNLCLLDLFVWLPLMTCTDHQTSITETWRQITKDSVIHIWGAWSNIFKYMYLCKLIRKWQKWKHNTKSVFFYYNRMCQLSYWMHAHDRTCHLNNVYTTNQILWIMYS